MKRIRHDPRYIATIAKLMPVLRTHEPFRGMGFEQLCNYLAYFWNHGTMSYLIYDDDSPAGVCLIKIFRELDSFLDEFVHEPDGKFCMIVLLAADTPIAMGVLCNELVGRWGTGWTMMWERGARTEDGAPRMYRWDQFEKLARRISYGVVENTRNV